MQVAGVEKAKRRLFKWGCPQTAIFVASLVATWRGTMSPRRPASELEHPWTLTSTGTEGGVWGRGWQWGPKLQFPPAPPAPKHRGSARDRKATPAQTAVPCQPRHSKSTLLNQEWLVQGPDSVSGSAGVDTEPPRDEEFQKTGSRDKPWGEGWGPAGAGPPVSHLLTMGQVLCLLPSQGRPAQKTRPNKEPLEAESRRAGFEQG